MEVKELQERKTELKPYSTMVIKRKTYEYKTSGKCKNYVHKKHETEFYKDLKSRQIEDTPRLKRVIDRDIFDRKRR